MEECVEAVPITDAVTELVDAIPVTGFAVGLLGDQTACSHAGGQIELAGAYGTSTDAWKAYHKIAEALGVAETPQVRNADAVARLVVHALVPPHPPVIVGSSGALRIDGKLIWSRACIDGEPDTIRIMPDFAGAYSWCEAGCQTSVDFAFPGLPVSRRCTRRSPPGSGPSTSPSGSPQCPCCRGSTGRLSTRLASYWRKS